MGDDGGKSPQWATRDVIASLKESLPQLVQLVTAQYDPAAKAEVDIARKYTPQIAQIQADTLGNQGKQLAAIGRDISAEEAKRAAETEAEISAGAGQKIVDAGLAAQQRADPEYYASRGIVKDAIAKLMDFDPNTLSKGETEGIARGLARTGSFVPSGMETAKNAVVFGQAGQQRRAQYGSALSQAAAASGALRGPVDATALMGRRQVMPNAGVAAYTGIQTPGVQNAMQMGANLQNTSTAAMNINMQKQKSDWEKYMQGLNATTSTIGSVAQIAGAVAGCWVARAVYGDWDPRWYVFRSWLFGGGGPVWLQRLYLKHGQAFAEVVKRSPLLKRVVKFAMDCVVEPRISKGKDFVWE